MEYVTKNGDTVEARGLTLTVELGEKTKNEIVSQAVARMQEATETIEKLLQALVEVYAENARLKVENEKLRDAIDYLYGFAKTLGVDEGDMRELGIEVK